MLVGCFLVVDLSHSCVLYLRTGHTKLALVLGPLAFAKSSAELNRLY